MTAATLEAPAYTQAQLIEWLAERADKSAFFASLVAQHKSKGALSGKQWDAAQSARQKWDAASGKKAENTVAVDLAPFQTLFDKAKASGLKFPKFFFGPLVVYPANQHPGVLYVKHDGEYVGKVAEGTFRPTASVRATTAALLQTVAADPLGAAVDHGKKTGQCSCCGRALTDPVSVADGIGPVCKKKWGL